MSISLVLADDHQIVLEGLAQLFRLEANLEVVARCTDGEQALQAVRQFDPDILVLDISMPGKNGLEVLREITQAKLRTRVVLLTAAIDEEQVVEALRLGVRGLALKEMAPQMLVECVRKVHAGEQSLDNRSVVRALEKVASREAEAARVAGLLTPRELEIVRMITSGRRNREIAAHLSISEGTVKVHLHNIYEKLQVNGRLELLVYAREHGIA